MKEPKIDLATSMYGNPPQMECWQVWLVVAALVLGAAAFGWVHIAISEEPQVLERITDIG